MSIREAYNQWSPNYDTDRNLTRDLDHQATLKVLGNSRHASILEIGCGTGKNTRLLSQIGENVLAVDFSRGMLEQARVNAGSANVTFSLSDITQRWPCDDQAFGLVVCNLVLEHVGELEFIFSEAFRSLSEGGSFFVCELHPFRQYLGTRAEFRSKDGTTEIPAFVHHVSDFLIAAHQSGFTLGELKEWWHSEDSGKPPRLVSFMFRK